MKFKRFGFLLVLLSLVLTAQRVGAQCTYNLSFLISDIYCLGDEGALDAVVTGGTGPFSYIWSNGQTDAGIAGLSADTYTVTVTDGLGCISFLSHTITSPSQALSLTVADDGVITCQHVPSQIIPNVSGGTPPYTYLWDNGETTSTLSVTFGGTYTVTVTDANNCQAFKQHVQEVGPTYPVADPGPPFRVISCTTAPNILGGPGTPIGPQFTYAWEHVAFGFDESVDPTQPFIEITGFGIYNFTVTNTAEGCSTTSSIIVDNDGSFPTAGVAIPQVLNCHVSQITLDASSSSSGPQFSYLWTTVDGNIVSGSSTLNPVVDQPGAYIFAVTDNAQGCTVKRQINVLTDNPVANAGPDTGIPCNGSPETLSGSGSSTGVNFTYQWTTTDGNISNGFFTLNPIVISPGTYQLMVINTQNGCTKTDEVRVYPGPVIPDHDLSILDVSCTGQLGIVSVDQIQGTLPNTYLWSDGSTEAAIINIGIGIYDVTVTDGTGCNHYASLEVKDTSTLSLSILTTPPNCLTGNDGAIDLVVVDLGGFDYAWSNGATTQDLSNLNAGIYTVTVTYAIGTCTDEFSVDVQSASNLHIDTILQAANFCLGQPGSASLSVTGGSGTYSFLWDNGETTANATNLSAGLHSVTITDAGTGCIEILSLLIGDVPGFSLSAVPIPANCGQNNGSIDLSVTDGTAPFSYVWSSGVTTQDLINLTPGNYTPTVTDASGCTQSLPAVTVGALSAMVLTHTVTDAACNGACTGAIDLEVTGGALPYDYLWSIGSANQDLNNLCAGVYTITVTDGDGCTQTAAATIGNPSSSIVATAASTDASCNLNNGAIDLTVNGGSAPYTYAWSSTETTEDLSNLSPGIYTVTVTDANFCSGTLSASVGSQANITLSGTHVDILCAGVNTGSINLSVQGGTPPYNYVWNNASSTQDLIGLPGGIYSVTVSDNFACTQTSTFTILEFAALDLSVTTQNISCFGGIDGGIDITVTGGNPPYNFEWLPGGFTTEDLINLPAGSYCLTVTDFNGCSAISCPVVAQPAPLNASITIVSNGCLSETISVEALPNHVYQWLGPNGFTAATPEIIAVLSGFYSVTITSPGGCTATNSYTVNLSGGGTCGTLEGRVFQDSDESCTENFGEPGLEGWIVRAEGLNDTLYGITNSTGDYSIGVPVGTYTVKVFVPNGLWQLCAGGSPVTLNTAGDIIPGGDFPAQALYHCPAMSVSMGTNKLRRCFADNYYTVEYCNQGTETATDAYVTVILDPFLTALSASIPYTSSSNALHFDLGDVPAGDCGTFNIQVLVNCNAVIGQTHCAEAFIYPDTFCAPQNTNWSGASLRVSSICSFDSLRFDIRNIGKGGMNGSSNYIVVEDGIMFRSGVLTPLPADGSMQIAVPANGSTWRVEVRQETFHPYPAPVGLSIEGCVASSSFSTGFINQFAYQDESPAADMDCTTNTGSFDPNDKYGYPVGYGADHLIRPGSDIEYQIRFQNTGTDTAFTVRIIDTLASWLDPASLRIGASSHPCRIDLTGEGVVHFIFEEILLPDSNINAVASQGFAKFTIKPSLDAGLGTRIENTAAIYFDQNDPVLTNTTFHRLGENFISVGLWQPVVPKVRVLTSPNPFKTYTLLEIKGLEQDKGLHLQVMDLFGKVVYEQDADQAFFRLDNADWSPGVYVFVVSQQGRMIGSGKLVAE